MPPVLELVMSLLGGGDTLDKLTSITGADDAAQASDAARLSAPAILGGLAERTQDESGLETVMGMLDDNRPVLDDLGGFLDRAETEAGNTILDFLFAGDRADLVSGLAAKADLGGPVIGKLLPMLAPAVAAVVANERNLQELDGAGLAAMLNAETAAMDRDGVLYAVTDFPPPTAVTAGVASTAMAGAVGIGSAASGVSGGIGDGFDGATAAVGSAGDGAKAAVGGAGDAAGGAIGNAGDAIAGTTGSVGDVAAGAAGDAAGSAAGAASGAVSGAAEKVGDVAAGAAGAVGGAAEGVTGAAGATAGTAAAKAGDAKQAVTAGVKGVVGGDDGDGSGLGWLGWAIGAVALVLLLAWLLSQCNDEEAESTEADTTEVSVDADDEGVSAESDADDTDGDSADDADSNSTDDESTNDESSSGSDADGELQELVDGALRGTGVSGAVAGGDVTLTGTVDDSDTSDGIEDEIAAIDGVESVDNQIEVDGSDSSADSDSSDGSVDLDAGDTINELLDLDPVTFRVSSATITEAGIAVLDEAAEFLSDNPDIDVEIGGHTDSDGATAENLDLSERRADAVKAYLEDQGIDGDRMTTRGYGESEPKVPNTSAEGKAENRRIEFTVL